MIVSHFATDRRWATIGLVAMALTFVVPLWLDRCIPGRDLPQHVLMLTESLRSGDGAGAFAPDWSLVPGSLFYWLARPLQASVEPLLLARLALSIYVAGSVLGMGALSWAMHGRLSTAVPYGALLIYNFLFYEGAISTLLGLPAMLAAVALLVLEVRAPRVRSRGVALVTAVLALWLYLANVSLFLLFLAGWASMELLRTAHGSSSLGVWKPVAMLAAAGLFPMRDWHGRIPQSTEFDFLNSDGFGAPLRWHWPTFDRVFALTHELLGIWKSHSGYALWALPAVAYSIWLARGRIADITRTREFAVEHRGQVLLALLSLMAFALLWTFPDVTPVPGYFGGHRVFLWLFVALALQLRGSGRERPLERATAWVALPALCLACVLNVQSAACRQITSLQRTLDAIPHAGRVLFLDFMPNETEVVQNPLAFSFCWYHIRRGGASPYTFAWYVASPVRYRDWDLSYPPFGHAGEFRRWTHGFGYDAIVALGPAEAVPPHVRSELASWADSLWQLDAAIVGVRQPRAVQLPVDSPTSASGSPEHLRGRRVSEIGPIRTDEGH